VTDGDEVSEGSAVGSVGLEVGRTPLTALQPTRSADATMLTMPTLERRREVPRDEVPSAVPTMTASVGAPG
jgi:hypothetical protein